MLWNKKHSSIVWRLTKLYTLSIFIILSAMAIILYMSLSHDLLSESKSRLYRHSHLIVSFLSKLPMNAHEIEQEISVEPMMASGVDNRYYTQVVSSDGKILFATPGVEKIIKTHPKNNRFFYTNFHKKKFLAFEQPVFLLKDSHDYYIYVAISIESQRKILQKYFQVIMTILILGVGLSFLFGYFLARKSMQPLERITKKLKAMTTDQLHQRLDQSAFPEELVSLAQAFNTMCDGLENSFAKLKQFSADLAHELRTPINNLIGETELALTQERSIENYKKILISNLEEAQRISNMVSGLLFLAQAESSQKKVNKKTLDAKEVISDACEFYSALSEEKDIRINLSGSGSILADEVLFQRVIHNILSNALKYTPRHGKITISISANKKQTTITVVDTGVGIEAKDLPLVFYRFYRADKARTHSSGGLGLGLAIVKSIIDLHHADIRIARNPAERGTVVTMVFGR